MGYTTEFAGRISIQPELTPEQQKTINDFCEERHGGNMDVHAGMPGFWCDYETDGKTIGWNGSEKSYHMLEWMQLLIKRFFSKWGCILNGSLQAQGEDPSDEWSLVVRDNITSRKSIDWDVERR